jgi:tRNA modification GTPase
MNDGSSRPNTPDETIVALSTPVGRSGIGVVRLSGPRAFVILDELFRSKEADAERLVRFGTLESSGGETIDQVLATSFRGPNSYTGEDVVEISAHGNPLILNRIIEELVTLGASRAAAGEFTLRAVTNGKMDLLQAEAVRDFIDAQTDMQARTAMSQMNGALANRLRPMKESLVDVISRLEAGIDFAEDDVEVPDGEVIAGWVASVEDSIAELTATVGYGRLLHQGLLLAIAGKPNVGKSSIFNRLVSHDRAIVSEFPGTTRDVVTETVEVDGIPIRLADTAGVREGSDEVESIGISRTIETLAEADLTLAVFDSSEALTEDDRDVIRRIEEIPHLIVVNKRDLPVRWEGLNGSPEVHLSAKTGEGFDGLKAGIRKYVSDQRPPDTVTAVVTSARQAEALDRASDSLRAGVTSLRSGVPHEMVLLDLYGALSALGELSGEVVTDDILERIFSTFCIGK